MLDICTIVTIKCTLHTTICITEYLIVSRIRQYDQLLLLVDSRNAALQVRPHC